MRSLLTAAFTAARSRRTLAQGFSGDKLVGSLQQAYEKGQGWSCGETPAFADYDGSLGEHGACQANARAAYYPLI